MSKRRVVALFATMTILLSACGFQLRGNPTVGIKTLFAPGAGVALEIRRALVAGPTKVVAAAPEAEAHLRVISESRERQVHTITGTGRVYEFELRLIVTYEMLVPGREVPVIAPSQLVSRRLITYSEAAPIAKEQEEQLLYKDMQVEIADRILRQVALARRDM